MLNNILSLSTITFPNLGIAVDPPQSFSVFGLDIRLYGAIIAFGLMLAVIYALRRTKQFGLTQDDLLDGVIWVTPFAILCARLYYCAFEWDRYAHNPVSILYIWEGGLAIYGGVIGAILGVLVFCKIKKVKVGAVLDLLMLGFLIGQAIGRWGNFCNREAFGSYSDGLLAMRISEAYLHVPADASAAFLAEVAQMKEAAVAGGYAGLIQVHPTFLYESLWNTVGFVALHFLSKKRQYDGQIALGYAAWYGLGRAWIEGLRTDSLYWGPFRVSQVLAAASCLIAVVVLLIMALRKHDRANLFVNRVAAQKAAAEETGTQELPEEAPAEETPAEETPAEEVPAEETPAEEAPEEAPSQQ